MLFNSYVFIFAFLPITLLGFFLLGRAGLTRSAGFFLSAASLFFYGWWNPAYLPLIVGSIIFNYFVGVFLNASTERGDARSSKWLLAGGVFVNLVFLGYYKYANFFVENANAVLHTHFHLHLIALPLAISFFTFTQIAYLVDASRGHTKEYNFLYYFLFVTFFPHLIAGPIVLYRSLMPQFAQRKTYRFDSGNFSAGLTLFALGLFKKVVFADQLGPMATQVFTAAGTGYTPRLTEAWIGALAYALQLYFDFSGYSDMAIGLGKTFNVRFPLNFNSPYKARDIVDFWRRWHITLSQFLRDHLYIPLGGNRKGPVRRYANLFVTMLLGGLWHGAGWTFIIWGALHGGYLMVNQWWLHVIRERPWAHTWPMRLAGRVLTLLAVLLGWVFFRAGNFHEAAAMLRGMLGRKGLVGGEFAHADLLVLAVAGAIALFGPNTHELLRQAQPIKEATAEPEPLWGRSAPWAIAAGLVLGVSIFRLSGVSEFLYFRF